MTQEIPSWRLSQVMPMPESPILSGLPSNESMTIKSVIKRKGSIEGRGFKAEFIPEEPKGKKRRAVAA